MKRIALLIGVVLVLSACSSAKRTQSAINTGNYVSAINTAITKLKANKTRKGNQDIVLLLEEAFNKHVDRELGNIDFLKRDNNSGANYERIYNSYLALNSIQDRVQALLPLRVYDEDRDADFNFQNYDTPILETKNSLSNYLYSNASNLLAKAINKFDYRKAYQDFKYLNELNPNYRDTREKIEEAYQKGLDYVSVNLFNDTEIALPVRLEDELLNFNTYGLNNLWTRFHTNTQKDIKYDYEMQLKFNSILISPEQISTSESIKEKRIKDGWEYVLDDNGNVKKDSLGNDIKVDKFRVVKCRFYEHTQLKDVQIAGNVSYLDLNTKQVINSYPLASGFVFENIYADFQGDKRALNEELLKLTEVRAIPFPSDEQMIYDSGEDLKITIKNIIRNHGFN